MYRSRIQIVVGTLLAAAVLAFLPGLGVSAQEPGPVNFAYSYNVYRGDGGESSVALSYYFSENGLTYFDGQGALMVELQFFNEKGEAVDNYLWTVPHSLNGASPSDAVVAGVERFPMEPGEYRVGLRLVDAGNPQRDDSTGFEMSVRSLKGASLCVSDIELVSEMAPVIDKNSDHPFARNGYIVIPNINGLIAPPGLVLKSYIEIYNTQTLETPDFTVSYLIADLKGNGIYRRDTLISRGVTGSTFDVENVTVKGLRSGIYLLAARVFNGPKSIADDSVEVFRTIEVVNPKQDSLQTIRGTEVASLTNIIDPIYSGLTEEELDLEYEKTEPMILESARRVWQQLDGAEPKARFLTRFWMLQDNDPSTPEIPEREDFLDRVDHASKMFQSTMTPRGWDSDRGRVLIQYGKPDGIDRHPNDHNRKPYVIWRYNSRGYIFVFVDRTETGTYPLVHSTAPNEIRYDTWEADVAARHKQMYQGEF